MKALLRALVSVYRRLLPPRVRALIPQRAKAAFRARLVRTATDTKAMEPSKRVLRDAAAAAKAGEWASVVAVLAPETDGPQDEAPPRAYELLARAYRRLGEYAEAEATVVAGLHRYQGHVGLASELAEVAMAERDWPRALARWHAVLAADEPAPVLAYRQASRAHRRLGDFAASREVLDRGIEAHPGDLRLACERAESAMAERDWTGATRHWEGVVRQFGDRTPPFVFAKLSSSYAEQGHWRESDDAVQRGLILHPDAPVLEIERLTVAARRSDWPTTKRLLDEAAVTDAPFLTPDLYIGIARRFLTAFEFVAADAVIDMGLSRHPHDRRLLQQHVRNRIAEERRSRAPEEWRWDGALRRCEAALASMPDSGSPSEYISLSRDLSDATAHDYAKRLLRQGVGLHSDSRDLGSELATLAMATGDWLDAAELWRQALALAAREERPHITVKISRAYRCVSDYDNARRVIDQARVNGDDPRLAIEAAEIEREAGNLGAAIDILDRSVTDGIASVQAYRHLAIAYDLVRDRAAREAVVRRAQEHLPSFESRPGVVAIIGGGTSLAGVDLDPLRGQVHTVGVNATYRALPWVSQTVTHDPSHLVERFLDSRGPVLAAVPIDYREKLGHLPSIELRRRIIIDRMSETDDVLHSGGHTSAYTALNYAYLLRPRTIVLFGIDLRGFWGPDESWHKQMDDYNRRRYESLQRRETFDEFVEYRSRKLRNAPAIFASAVPQLNRAGIEVINASPVSTIDCFRRTTPEEGIERCLGSDRVSAD